MSNDMYPTLTVNLSDGTQHVAKIENPDMCRLEIVGGRNGFNLEDQKITSMTYLAWANLKRNGHYSENWDEFRESDCVGFDIEDDEDENDEGPLEDPKG